MSDLPRGEDEAAEEATRLSSRLVYEVVKREGRDELERPLGSLWWSGVAGGVGISVSLIAQGVLQHQLPNEDFRPLIANLGYSAGFVIVILGRLQLFTENTITPILTLLAEPSWRTLWRTARLWGVVFAANAAGTLMVAVLNVLVGTVPAGSLEQMLEVSRHFAALTPLEALLLGIPAGYLVAAVVWLLPSTESAGLFVIIGLTWLIALGDFAHVVVGAAEVFHLVLAGELGLGRGIFGLILPAFVGNVLGGTGMFALLAYGQVREEM